MNLLDGSQVAAPAVDQETDPFGEAVTAAVMKRWGNKAGGDSGGRRQPGDRTPSLASSGAQRFGGAERGKIKCVNCGSEDHIGMECPKPRIEDTSKRPCWKCGNACHISQDCRGGGQAARLVDKVAPSDTYRHEGADGEKRQTTTRGHWLPQSPGVRPILERAEAPEGETIKASTMVEALGAGHFIHMDPLTWCS